MACLGDLVDCQVFVDDEGAAGVFIAHSRQKGRARGIVDCGVVNDGQARLHIVEDLSSLLGGEVARLRGFKFKFQDSCSATWSLAC